MNLYVISDNVDTQTGFRLVGINGCVVHEKEELKKALNKVVLNKEIGILMIVENLVKLCPEMINEIKLNRHLPLIVEIPDRHGSGRTPDFISSYIKEAIGVKL